MTRSQTDSRMVEIGRRMEDRRKSRRWTRAEIAAELGVTPARYAQWERGVNVMPVVYLSALANALRVPIGYFFGGERESVSAAFAGAGVSGPTAVETPA